VPQEAWLMNCSVRENILFGLKYKKKRYQRTLEVCQLESDLLLLPNGDETEIGERGVNLSGGQQQR
jgi:ABC-type multidrug transport system fused ATPase/permease subunit